MTLRELLTEKREEILAIAARRGASNVRIFGSVARGEERQNSDIDFLVDFAPETSLLTHAGLVVDLQKLLGRKVDVVRAKSLKPRLKDSVLSEAVPL